MKNRPYKRLGRGTRLAMRESLYLGVDHLLLRSSNALTENYRRFYFRDIESLTVAKSARMLLWSAVWAILLLIMIAIFFRVGPGPISGTFVGIFALALLINVLRGPSCTAQLQTRVQRRSLPLFRLNRALRTINDLVPRIRGAQAEAAPAPSTAAAPERDAAVPVPPMADTAMPPPLPGTVSAQGSPLHVVTFFVLLVSAALSILEAVQHHVLLMYVVYALCAANLGLGIAALIVQRRRRVPARAKAIVWADVVVHTLGLPILFYVFTFLHMARFTSARPGEAAPPSPQELQLSLANLRAIPEFEGVLLGYGAVCAVFGLIGAVLLLTGKKAEAAGG